MKTGSRFSPLKLAAVVVLLAFSAPTAVQAFEIKNQAGEVIGSFDTTISLGGSWRAQGRDSSLVSIANGGTSRDPNADDGDLIYDKNKLFSNPVKVTHELGLKRDNYGMFARGTYSYDFEYYSRERSAVTGYGPRGWDKLGTNGELLDLFAYGSVNLGGRRLTGRLGQQVVSWGEGTFIPNGINAINPIDLAKLRGPGSELREALLPQPMIWASRELSNRVSLEGFYQLKHRKIQLDPRGTFFSTNDFVVDDGAIAYTGFGRRNDQHGAGGVFPAVGNAQLTAPRSPGRDPSDSGQFGFALRFLAPELNNTEFGAYFMNYHSRVPFVSGFRGGITAAGTISNTLTGPQAGALAAAGVPAFNVAAPGCRVLDIPTFGALHTAANIGALAPLVGGVAAATGLSALNATNAGCLAAAGRAGTYFVDYPENIRLFGLSFNTPGPAGTALQGEYSYRPNQPVQLPSAELLLAALGLSNQLTSTTPLAAAGVSYNSEIAGYRRVQMHQLQMTATKALGPTLGAEQFVLLGEVGFAYLNLPSNLKFAGPGVHLPQPGSSGTSAFNSFATEGFATTSSWGYRLAGRLDFPNAIGAATLSPRILFAHDVHGVSPTFNQGTKAATFGLSLNYKQNWQAEIAYTTFWGGRTFAGTDTPSAASGALPPGQPATYASSANPLKDRDFISLSVTYSF